VKIYPSANYLSVLQKRKYLVLAITVACILLAIGVSFVMTPYYGSMAMVEIQRPQNDVGDLGALANALSDDDDVKTEIQTAVSILQSDSLALETIERMHYEQHRKAVRPSAERNIPLRAAPATRQTLLNVFEKHLSITPVTDTRVVQVTFKDPDANYAAQTANALIDQYIQDSLARRNSATVQASQWMEGEIKDLQTQVQSAQQRLIDFEKQSGLIALPSSGGSGQPGAAASSSLSSPVLNRLTQLNQDLVTAETTLVSREAINQVAKSGDADAFSTMAVQMQGSDPSGAASSNFAGLESLRQQKGALKIQMATALNTYGPKIHAWSISAAKSKNLIRKSAKSCAESWPGPRWTCSWQRTPRSACVMPIWPRRRKPTR
jgi:polysaccharide biosynthesis transport protein